MNRQTVRYRILSISKKINLDLRISIGGKTSPEFHSTMSETDSTSLILFPILSLSITRERMMDENGRYMKSQWDRDDSLIINKYSLPLFINELKEIYNQLKLPNLFKYTNKRLELNDKLAEESRRVFMIGDTTIELSIVVIKETQDTEDIYYEGIKIKFNNEDHVVVLNINEMTSLLFSLNKLDIDILALNLYNTYIRNNMYISNNVIKDDKTIVDILPVNKSFKD